LALELVGLEYRCRLKPTGDQNQDQIGGRREELLGLF
jgi:hypothetical protein